MAQRAIGAEPHGVGTLPRGKEPHLAGVGVLNRLGGNGESVKQEQGGCTVHEYSVNPGCKPGVNPGGKPGDRRNVFRFSYLLKPENVPSVPGFSPASVPGFSGRRRGDRPECAAAQRRKSSSARWQRRR